jgi:hypothetical protein
MKSIIGFFNNSNLHATISTLLIINLHRVKKIYFAVLVEIYNNVGSAVLISRNHSITRLISFDKKTVQIRDQFFPYMDPWALYCASEANPQHRGSHLFW